MDEFRTACRVDELVPGEGKLVELDGKYFAIDDVCPHMGGSLSEGAVQQGIVTCPWHGWRFRLADGAWADSPRVKIGAYPVHEADGSVQLEFPDLPQTQP